MEKARAQHAALLELPGRRDKHNQHSREWYRANREEINLRRRLRRAADPEGIRRQKRVWGAANRDKINQQQKALRAANLERYKQLHKKYYQKNDGAAKRRQLREANPDRERANDKRRRELNPEKSRLKNKVATHKRRAKIQNVGGSFTALDIKEILKGQGKRCAYCRKALGKNKHIDHIVPIAMGGTNFRQNIQLTCIKCNLRKNSKDPIDFARQLGMLL